MKHRPVGRVDKSESRESRNLHREPEAPFLPLDEDEVLAGAAVSGSHRSRR